MSIEERLWHAVFFGGRPPVVFYLMFFLQDLENWIMYFRSLFPKLTPFGFYLMQSFCFCFSRGILSCCAHPISFVSPFSWRWYSCNSLSVRLDFDTPPWNLCTPSVFLALNFSCVTMDQWTLSLLHVLFIANN